MLGLYRYLKLYESSGGYATRSFGVPGLLIPDHIGEKLGEVCIVNLSKSLNTLKAIDPETQNLELRMQRIYAQGVIFHEARHCSSNQFSNPYNEMEAEYAATKALALQFNIKSARAYMLSRTFDFSENHLKYDFTLYKEFRDKGQVMPSQTELDDANRNARNVIRSQLKQDSSTYLIDRTVTDQNGSASELKYEINPDITANKDLSPLAQRRVAHFFAQMITMGLPGWWYEIDHANQISVFPTDQKTGRRLKPSKSPALPAGA